MSHTKSVPSNLILYESERCSVLLVDQEVSQEAQQNLKCYSKVILIYCKMSATWLYLTIWLELIVER